MFFYNKLSKIPTYTFLTACTVFPPPPPQITEFGGGGGGSESQ